MAKLDSLASRTIVDWSYRNINPPRGSAAATSLSRWTNTMLGILLFLPSTLLSFKFGGLVRFDQGEDAANICRMLVSASSCSTPTD